MAFTNTVETVGDAALTRSIIDRTITELNCNITTSIRQYAFRACAALASVNFPSVTSVALGAFWQCTALKRADFASAAAFANNAFYGCTQLSAVILRSTDQLCTISGTPFAASAIASGTGYIYVPAALVDQYKASWSTYAAQIRAIEDYLGIADMYSWTGVAANIADGSYASVYKVGDCVELDLGNEGKVNMQIAAFDADELADGTGYAPISWVSKELLTTMPRMNPDLVRVTDDSGATVYTEGTGNVGGWEKCEMRTYLNDTIKPLISSDVLAMIKPVIKYSRIKDTTGASVANATTTDDIWIPSDREIFNRTAYESAGPAYAALFSDNYTRTKHKVGSSSGIAWWLRTAEINATVLFVCVSNNGMISTASASLKNTVGIALGFCT